MLIYPLLEMTANFNIKLLKLKQYTDYKGDIII